MYILFQGVCCQTKKIEPTAITNNKRGKQAFEGKYLDESIGAFRHTEMSRARWNKGKGGPSKESKVLGG